MALPLPAGCLNSSVITFDHLGKSWVTGCKKGKVGVKKIIGVVAVGKRKTMTLFS